VAPLGASLEGTLGVDDGAALGELWRLRLA
jgi:hypothetical protein